MVVAVDWCALLEACHPVALTNHHGSRCADPVPSCLATAVAGTHAHCFVQTAAALGDLGWLCHQMHSR